MKTLKQAWVLLVLLISISVHSHASNAQNISVYFDKDKFQLQPAEQEKLNSLKDGDLVFLDGYTDDDGSTEYNQKLSQKRVEYINGLLAKNNPGVKFDKHYFGELRPLNSNSNEAEKQINRRVDIVCISNPLLSFKTPVQHFTIDNSKDQVITASEGTLVEIPKGVFNNKMVEIELSEHYKPLAILSEQLTTTSNGKPIETAGMIRINAKVNGVDVQPTGDLTYKFPRNNDKTGYVLFSGVRNKDYSMNWVQEQTTDVFPSITIAGTSSSSQDIYKETEKFWADIKENILNENITVKQYQCLNMLQSYIVVNDKGLLDTIFTNYKDKNRGCDKIIKTLFTNYLPARFGAKESGSYSNISMSFSDFLPAVMKKEYGSMLLKEATNNIAVNYIEAKNQVFEDARQAEQEKYLAKSLEAFTRQQKANDSIKSANATIVDVTYRTLASKQLGWINCDRFYNNTKNINFNVRTANSSNIIVVLKNYKSFFDNEYSLDNDTYSFYNVPSDEPAIIISTYKKGGKIFLAINDVKTTPATFTVTNYKEVTKEELKEAINNLKI